jgi:hypothetical protein
VSGAVGLQQHLGAGRHPQLERVAIGAVALGPAPTPAGHRGVARGSPVGLQIAQRIVADEHDIATATAVAAVGSAPRNVGLPAEAETAVSTGSGRDMDARSILHTL